MAYQHHYHQQQPQHQGYQSHVQFDKWKSFRPQNGSSASNFLASATLVPVEGTLLLLAGLTLAETIIGLALTTPFFVIFSQVLIPVLESTIMP
ncbi:hypothetical protein ACFXTO_010534 [Malus domestica]